MTIKLFDLIDYVKTLSKILILSVSSTKFYCLVYRKFTGCGLKYILSISLIAAFIQIGLFLFNINLIYESYFAQNNQAISNLEYIINQIPFISIKNGNIKTDTETIYKIQNKNQKIIFAIDANNQLSYTEKNKIPVVFSKNTIFYPVTKDLKNQYKHWSTSYDQLFGKYSNNLNSNEIINKLKTQYEILSHVIIIFGFPILAIGFCVLTYLKKLLIIFLIYLTNQFSQTRFSLKTSTKLVMFTAGPELLTENLAVMFPIFSIVPSIFQVLTTSLLVIAILQIQKKNYGAP